MLRKLLFVVAAVYCSSRREGSRTSGAVHTSVASGGASKISTSSKADRSSVSDLSRSLKSKSVTNSLPASSQHASENNVVMTTLGRLVLAIRLENGIVQFPTKNSLQAELPGIQTSQILSRASGNSKSVSTLQARIDEEHLVKLQARMKLIFSLQPVKGKVQGEKGSLAFRNDDKEPLAFLAEQGELDWSQTQRNLRDLASSLVGEDSITARLENKQGKELARAKMEMVIGKFNMDFNTNYTVEDYVTSATALGFTELGSDSDIQWVDRNELSSKMLSEIEAVEGLSNSLSAKTSAQNPHLSISSKSFTEDQVTSLDAVRSFAHMLSAGSGSRSKMTGSANNSQRISNKSTTNSAGRSSSMKLGTSTTSTKIGTSTTSTSRKSNLVSGSQGSLRGSSSDTSDY